MIISYNRVTHISIKDTEHIDKTNKPKKEMMWKKLQHYVTCVEFGTPDCVTIYFTNF